MQAPAQQREYFNLHTNGIGYLNRIRWVETQGRGRKADPFLACSIAALRGSTDSAEYTYFDVRVNGREAIELIEGVQAEVEANRKVIVNFRIADIYPHLYERNQLDQNRKPTGHKEWATLIKGRLILINSISVDGEKVYVRPANEEAGADASDDPQGGNHMDGDAPAEEAPQAQQPPRQAAPQPRVVPLQTHQRRQPSRAHADGTPQGAGRREYARA